MKFSDVSGAVLDFMVSPDKQADALAEAWNSNKNIVKAYLRYTSDPSTRAVCDPIELVVVSVTSNSKGDISVVVKENASSPLAEDFWNGNQDAVIYLRISDGSNELVSELIDAIGYFHVSLSERGTANCYIVSEGGLYKFGTVMGNSSESVGTVASAEVLWESFGTDVKPSVGALIKKVEFNNVYIAFQTSDAFKEGNAIIAAKDANDKTLWSWHIWFTDQPEEQVYYYVSGIMMDRNLGAISATPGDAGTLGLLYQWGRKDPFLGSSSISGEVDAKSTIVWPSAVLTSSSKGTVSYVTANPTTYVMASSSSSNDWHYAFRDNALWTTLDEAKSVYDPCPAGWRVPNGGYNGNGVWSRAGFDDSTTYDNTNEGMLFRISSWYPASGYRYHGDGALRGVGDCGSYWSSSSSRDNANYAYDLYFTYEGYVNPSFSNSRASAQSVRCLKDPKKK